jgi:hypothetical protein
MPAMAKSRSKAKRDTAGKGKPPRGDKASAGKAKAKAAAGDAARGTKGGRARAAARDEVDATADAAPPGPKGKAPKTAERTSPGTEPDAGARGGERRHADTASEPAAGGSRAREAGASLPAPSVPAGPGWPRMLLSLAGIAAGAVVLLVIRLQEEGRATRILAGEARALQQLVALDTACRELGGPERLPPDPAAVLRAAGGLRPLDEDNDGNRAFASDDVYVYGVGLTRGGGDEDGPPGSVIRAWPLRFGITGDAEFVIDEGGQLWEGLNEVGRSGTTNGFPPPFPEGDLGLPRRPWWRRPLPDHR